MKTLLTIENLTTGYPLKKNDNLILHSGISTVVKEGEFIAVLGPNGAGKTTLLKTLAGFVKKIDGKILYNNVEIEKFSIKELAKTISIMLTEKPEDIYLDVFEIISSGRYPYGSLLGDFTKEDLSAIENAAELTYVSELIDRKFVSLSDGEKQRVMLARALAQDTPLIFLDEPTAFIDSPGKTEMMGLMKNIALSGKTVIASIHDVELALNYAGLIWLVGKNGYFETGEPEFLVNKGKINKVFDTAKVKFDIEEIKFKPVDNFNKKMSRF